MTKLKIRTETPPQRCEICHQNDSFEPESGLCRRCQNLNPAELIPPEETLSPIQSVYARIGFAFHVATLRVTNSLRQVANHAQLIVMAAFMLFVGLLMAIFVTTINNKPNYTQLEDKKHTQTEGRQPAQIKATDYNNSNSEYRYSNSERSLPSPIYIPDRNGAFTNKPGKPAQPRHEDR